MTIEMHLVEQHLLNVVNVSRPNAECCYAECRYAECQGAPLSYEIDEEKTVKTEKTFLSLMESLCHCLYSL
jgi:hypothetical protein